METHEPSTNIMVKVSISSSANPIYWRDFSGDMPGVLITPTGISGQSPKMGMTPLFPGSDFLVRQAVRPNDALRHVSKTRLLREKNEVEVEAFELFDEF